MRELTIDLQLNQKTPLYEQIYDFIKEEIKCGRIGCKTKLPSTRALAAHLQISRSTVDMAYTQLISEGYIESIPYRGYYVSEISLLYDINNIVEVKERDKEVTSTKELIDFSPWGIDLDAFPFATWRKISRGLLSADNKELFSSGDSKGEYSLRKTLCNYLYEARGVRCTPDMIIVGAGNEYMLMLLNQIFKGKPVIAMENPTYVQAYQLFCKNDNKIIPISLDKSGISIKELRESDSDIAYVMPSHQFPLGTVMPIKRRLELLEWTKQKEDRYIIEDDYDSEFRYRGKPIPSLQGVDADGKVIYIGTVSKSIAPAIRMSYMVLPQKLLKIYEENMNCSQTVSRIDQMIVTEFFENGYFERHLNKMRSIYKAKHDLLLAELKTSSGKIEIHGENSGLHILLTVNNSMSEKKLILTAKECGVKVYGLSDYFIEKRSNILKPTIVLGFANLNEQQIKQGISKLKQAWKII